VSNRTLWFSTGSPRVTGPARGAYLLPNYDEYTVAYKDRSDLSPGVVIKAEDLLTHTIVLDGRMVGSWKRTIKKHEVIIETRPLLLLSTEEERAIAHAAERYGIFLGLPVKLVPEVSP
jgi:hypothetical protein